MVILDTNIIIEYLRLKDPSESTLVKLVRKHTESNLGISLITLQELYQGKSSKVKEEEQRLLLVISPLKIFEYNFNIAKKAGEITRDSMRVVEKADAIIALTAIHNNLKLATLDRKDFEDIKGVVLEDL